MTAPTKLPAFDANKEARRVWEASRAPDGPRGRRGGVMANALMRNLSRALQAAFTAGQATPPIAAPADAERERLAALCESRGNLCQRKADSARSDDAYVGTIERWQQEADDQRAIAILLRAPAPEPQPAGEG